MAMPWNRASLSTLADFSLLQLNPVLLRNFVQLFASKLLWRCSRSAAYLAKKRFESRWCDDPNQQEFTVGILNSMPNALRNINCRTLFNWRACIVQYAKAGAFQNEQHFICFLMLMDLNTRTD